MQKTNKNSQNYEKEQKKLPLLCDYIDTSNPNNLTRLSFIIIFFLALYIYLRVHKFMYTIIIILFSCIISMCIFLFFFVNQSKLSIPRLIIRSRIVCYCI